MRFQNKAKMYDSFAKIQNDLLDWGLGLASPVSLRDDNVLELGCGTGLLSKELDSLGPKSLQCTDISASMIESAQQKHPQIDFSIHNALKIKSEVFDKIFSSSLIQWFKYPNKTFKNWHSMLNRNGEVYAFFFIDRTLSELQAFGPKTLPLSFHSLTFWKNCFRDSGFNIIQSESMEKRYFFPNSLALLRHIHNTGAYEANRFNVGCLRKILKEYDKAYRVGKEVYSTWEFALIHAYKS